MPTLPGGTLSLLFTDIEGSTRLLQQLGPQYADLLAEHQRILHEACTMHHGEVVDTEGDACFMVFARAKDAVEAAIAAQRALHADEWANGATLRVRMGIHTGTPDRAAEGYVGIDVHRAARIAAVAHGGQILISEATRGLLGADLPLGVALRELGEHRLKDLQHPIRLLQLVGEGLPANFPPLRSLTALPNNLPLQLTSFVGREREITEVKARIASSRLVTLTGAGGTGKTRLALQVAAEILETLPDGAWWVDLSPLGDAALIPQAVATALGTTEQAGRSMLDALRDTIADKQMVLILDNCEHVLEKAAGLSDRLLRGCPRLRILATSREGLAVAGEHLYPVPPLAVPDPKQHFDAMRLVEYGAVRLFVERACAVQPAFTLTQGNAETVGRICFRLDGIPLAIEMAAARVRGLPVEEIASRLQDRFRLLAGARTSLPRHQTLRAAMDWSHGLLLPAERVLFRRLGAFIGGFGLEAAEAVCVGDDVQREDILELLTGLLDKSLLIPDLQTGETRYRMLETVRQYARDRLLEAEEAEVVAARHLSYFVEFAQGTAALLREEAAERMDRDQDNLRAALEWAWAQRDLSSAYRLAERFYKFWNGKGFWTEGRRWMSELLASTKDVEIAPKTLSTLHFAAGLLAFSQGDVAHAQLHLEEALAIARSLNDRGEEMWAVLNMLGVVTYRQGDYEKAATYLEEGHALRKTAGRKQPFNSYLRGIVSRLRGQYEDAERLGSEALTLHRELGEWRGVGLTLDSLAMLAYYRGRYGEAADLGSEALAILREHRNKFGIYGSLNTLALIALAKGDHDVVRRLCEESLSVSRELDAKPGIARALQTLGRLELREDQVDAAAHHLVESLSMFSGAGERLGIMRCLIGLAGVALSHGDAGRAATLLGSASAIEKALGIVPPSVERDETTQLAEHARSRVGSEGFAAAWEAGRAMDGAEAVTFALGPAEARRK